jgi:ectoine hydroxylase-related dioxygenase (phytanoyl-CoA dioxygenase family)
MIVGSSLDRDLAEQLDELQPAFQREGAVCVRQAFAPHWLAMLETGIAENLAKPGPMAKTYTPDGKPGMFFGDYCNGERIAGYGEFLLHSPAAEIAGRLMGAPKVNLFHEHVLVKEPGTLEPTPWHHDQPYWTVDGTQVCSIWLSLDPVARASAVEFVAGSHLWGKWFSPARFSDSNPHVDTGFEPVPDIAADRDRYTLLGWDLAPGDCIVFHALTSRWCGDDARFVLREGYMSPPPLPGAPPPGSPMDSGVFPVVWRAA